MENDMTDTITLTGLVATTPRHLITGEGLPITSFRLASTQRRFDRSKEKWVDGETNWYTVTTFRQLAINLAGSVSKGDRIVTTGRLRIRDWENGERAGTNIEVEADAVGHDLSWGTSSFSRTIVVAAAPFATSVATEGAAAEGAADEDTEARDSAAGNDAGEAASAESADALLPGAPESVAVPF
jgi:single-strand DNA-binding protein